MSLPRLYAIVDVETCGRAGRMPLEAPIHADNRRYLAAKATRAGHRLDHLLGRVAGGRLVLEGDREPVEGEEEQLVVEG